MLIVGWRGGASPRAALAALSFAGALLGAAAPAEEEQYDASALLVVGWTTPRAPRAALANLYRNTTSGPESTAQPVPDSFSRVSRPQAGWTRRAPRALTWALYGNQALNPADGPVPPAASPGDATSLLVVRWDTQRAPRAALRHTRGGFPGDFTTAPVVIDETAGSVPRVPAGGWARKVPRAALAAAWRWQVGDEPEPYGDASAITVVAWRGGFRPGALRAAQSYALNPSEEPSSTAPVIQPETAGGIARKPSTLRRAAPHAALRNLYGNQALEPSSTAAAPEEGPDVTTEPRLIRWATRLPKAALANLYGNAALEIPPVVPGIPQAVSASALGRYRPFRTVPKAIVVLLYRNVSPFDGDGPAPEVPPTVAYIDFVALAPDLTFVADAPNAVFRGGQPALTFKGVDAPQVTFAGTRPALEFSGGG